MVARIKVVLSGTLGTAGVERWACGLHFAGGSAIGPTDLNAVAQAIGARISTDWSTTLAPLRNLLSTAGTLARVQVYNYGSTGPATAMGDRVLPIALTGNGTPACPPQVAVVCTLLTGQAGKSYRGRIYWPALNGAMNAALEGGSPTTAAPAFAQLLNGIAQDINGFGAYEPVVYSPTLDAVTNVTQVRVGNRLDTQRRRRDDLIEAYTYATL